MELLTRIAVSATLAAALTGFMTIRKGPTQQVTFVSAPPAARVTIDAGGTTIMTPGKVDLKRDQSHVAMVEKDGYQPTTVVLNRDVSMDVFQNFICIGVFAICFAVDFLTGDAFELKPDPVSVTLVAAPAAVAPAPATATEAPTRGSPPIQ